MLKLITNTWWSKCLVLLVRCLFTCVFICLYTYIFGLLAARQTKQAMRRRYFGLCNVKHILHYFLKFYGQNKMEISWENNWQINWSKLSVALILRQTEAWKTFFVIEVNVISVCESEVCFNDVRSLSNHSRPLNIVINWCGQKKKSILKFLVLKGAVMTHDFVSQIINAKVKLN